MAKYSKKIVDQICSLIQKDSYTISEICSIVGINKDTYHSWVKTKPDFSDCIKKANEERIQFFVCEAKRSLLKKLQGYDIEESKTVYIDNPNDFVVDENGKKKQKPKIKEKTIIKKSIQPDTTAIIFTLTNGDPGNWKNRQSSDINAKVDTAIVAKPMSRKEALQILKENGIE